MTTRSKRKGIRSIKTELADAVFYCGNRKTKAMPTNESWFLTRTIDCGLATKKFIALQLQIPLHSIKSLRWNRDYFEVHLAVPGIPRCMLKKFRPSEQTIYARVGAFRVINDLVLIVPGVFSGVPVRTFLNAASKVLATTIPHELFAVLYNDTHYRIVESDAQSLKTNPMPDRPDRMSQTEFPYYEWGNEHLRSIFMFTPMIRSRVPFSGVRTERMQDIVHGDNECVYMADQPDPLHFTGIVDMGAMQETAVLFPGREKIPRDLGNRSMNTIDGNIASILYDEDIIQGATLRLKQLLNAIAKAGITSDLLVNCTCTPLIIGDDVCSLIKNVNAQKHTSFLYCDAVKQSANDIYFEYVKTLVAGLKKYSPISGTINLVGFPQMTGVAELINVLAMREIRINTCVLPRIGPLNCAEYYKGQLQVFFPNADNMNLYEQIFFPLDRPHIMLDAPYGFKRTRDWVEGIGGHFQITPAAEIRWHSFYDEKEIKWTMLTQKARHYRVGMVVSPDDVPRLCDPVSSVACLPLIPFLEEMGFALDIFIYCPPERFMGLREKISALFSCTEDHRITHGFGTKAVHQWLRESECVCVYSDLLIDPRLSRSGKTRFSIADFEMGFDGALRTIQRLLGKCENIFYSRYRHYFEEIPTPIVFMEK